MFYGIVHDCSTRASGCMLPQEQDILTLKYNLLQNFAMKNTWCANCRMALLEIA